MSLAENVKKQPKIDTERHLMVQICNETPNLYCFDSKSSKTRKKHMSLAENAKKQPKIEKDHNNLTKTYKF